MPKTAPCFRCMAHGPSPAVLKDGELKCERCVKRPIKSPTQRQELALKKCENPADTTRIQKQRAEEYSQLTRSAYLQLTSVPDPQAKGSDSASIQESCAKQAKQRAEVVHIRRKRQAMLRQVCRAYSLPLPYFYSPFVCHPHWLAKRLTDTSEYLHNVQAIVQSFERRDNLGSLEEMKDKENHLYRTTKKAAWKVFYIHQDVPPAFDILYDQDSAASYKQCVKKMKKLAGERPKATVPDNCHPSYWDSPRAEGSQRKNSNNTYNAEKYRLKGYRHQSLQQYPAPYMVKAIVKMNQALCPRGVGKRNFSIMKHMRTALKVRELFDHHNQEFHQEFKQLLAEHAKNMDDPKVARKWHSFLNTGDPPRQISQFVAMTSVAADRNKQQNSKPNASQNKQKHSCPNCLLAVKLQEDPNSKISR